MDDRLAMHAAALDLPVAQTLAASAQNAQSAARHHEAAGHTPNPRARSENLAHLRRTLDSARGAPETDLSSSILYHDDRGSLRLLLGSGGQLLLLRRGLVLRLLIGVRLLGVLGGLVLLRGLLLVLIVWVLIR